MNLIALAIRQPVTISVGVILVILSGVIALQRLPVQLTPSVESTVCTVTTFWEGASPEEVERNVVDRQEERLIALSNLNSITSQSMQSQGIIRLEFNTGTDKDNALREISDKLREVPVYPDGVDEPVIAASDRESRDYIAWIMFGSTDPDFDVRVQRDFAVDRIEPFLERVPGISEINVLGGREREVQIRIDPTAMAQLGITPTMLANAIQQTNRNASAGQVEAGKSDIRLRVVSQYQTLREIEDTVIRDTDAGPVYVRDIADVVQTFKEPTSFVRSNGRPVIAINAELEVGANVMSVMDGLKDAIATLNAPGGVLEGEAHQLGLNGTFYLDQVYDQTIYIDDAIALVRNNIFIGGALATVVLLLFLRTIRSVSVVVMAIPISIVGAIVAMVMMGRSMNVISLAGMAFTVGMVVDNAIVVLENIFRHLEMGKKPARAAYDGTREVWGAVLASTLTTIVVFIPILLIQEQAGQLFRDIALAICAAVGLSLIVSITVIPCASARILRQRQADEDASKVGAAKSTGKPVGHGVSGWLAGMLYRLLGGYITRVAVVSVLTVVAIFGTISLIPPADYLPTGNRNLVFGMIIPPPGYNVDQMSAMGARMEDIARPYWEAGEAYDQWQSYEAQGDSEQAQLAQAQYEQLVEQLPEQPTIDFKTMSPGDPVVPPSISNYFVVSFENIIFHGAISNDPTRVADIVTLLNNASNAHVLPGTFGFAFQAPLFQLGGTTGSAAKLELSGENLDEIVRVAGQFFGQLMHSLPGAQIQPVPGNFMVAGPETQVQPVLRRVNELGLTPVDVQLLGRAAGDGAIIGDYTLGGETIDLKLISIHSVDDPSLASLPDLPIAAPGGRIVPISDVAEIVQTSAPQEIARTSRLRSVTFQITPPENMPLEQLVNTVETMIADARQSGAMPPTIQTSLTGSASKLQSVRTALLGDGTFLGLLSSSLMLSLLVVYLLMCVLFQSFLRPLVIMFSVPLATLGGFIGLSIIHKVSDASLYMPLQKLDVVTMLGFVILIGVVVNNAILIVHQTLNFLEGRAEIPGHPTGEIQPRRAIAEAVRTRVRPIFMSTFTSVGGMLPLVLMPGSGSELYRGLGSVVVGGLLVSTIFTLLLVPMLLSLVFDIAAAMGFRHVRTAVVPAQTEDSATPTSAGAVVPAS
jgi:HAE1 family hydrophobic/amphiphilic exporter-1